MMDNDIIEIIDDIEHNSPKSNKELSENTDLEKKVSEATYNTIEPEKEKIEIIEDYEPSKNKSGLLLVVVLFIILVLFIVFLPQISSIFGRLS